MAANQEHASRAQRLTSLGAIVLLALATTTAFGRVFVGHAATWKLIAAAAVSLAVATLLERRGLLLAILVSSALLIVVTGLLVFPHSTWYGLPTGQTLSAIRTALGRVGEQTRVQVAPAPALAPLMLAAVTAVWTAVFSAHALAIRAGSPLLAILPPVALVGFADTVLEDGARPGYALLFLAAALLVVFLDGLRRIRLWGPIWTWHGRERSVTRSTTSGARKVALVAIAVAALVPGVLPGFRSGALVDFSTSNADLVNLDPFVSIKAQLQERTPIDVFRVTSVDGEGNPAASYWRLYALDEFDGTTFRSSDPRAARGRLVEGSAAFPLFSVPADAPTVQQRYEILADINQGYIPMAYPPQSIEAPLDAIRFDQDLVSAVAPQGLSSGLEYSVTSRGLWPSSSQLNQVVFSDPSGYVGYTTVPASVPDQVRQIALRWTADATTAYQKVYEIQQHLLSSFTYSLDVKLPKDPSAIVEFLTKTRTGFCQQFAVAMAVLVRELGIPARLVVGYLPGERTNDTFTVTTKDAHSWVEVLFPGYGWLPFDPTPGRTKPPAPSDSYLNPVTGSSGAGGGAQGSGTQFETGTSNTCASGLPGQLCKSDTSLTNPTRPIRGGPADLGPLAGQTPTGPSPYRIALWVLAGLAVLFVLLYPVVKGVWRRAILHRGTAPRDLVLTVYRVFDGEAADVGLGRGEGETMAEYRRRLRDSVTFSDGHLDRLTTLATTAAYSGREVTEQEARDAARDAHAAIRDIRRQAGVVRRTIGIYRLGL